MFPLRMIRPGRLIWAALVLISGLAILPFRPLLAERLTWQRWANVYNPDLDVVGEDKGFPGSAFLFRGLGYPPNTLAFVYIDGDLRGDVTTDATGRADFLIQTEPGDPFGRYFVTLVVDDNLTATDDFRLEDDEPILPPPPGFDGPIFFLTPDPTPTPSVTLTPSPVPTATGTPQPSPTPTASATPAPSQTPDPSQTPTPSQTPSPTPTPSETPPPSPTPSETPEPNPRLDVLEDDGAPGSSFLFTAERYPALTEAIVAVDGVVSGSLITDEDGKATFLIHTNASHPVGRYVVSLTAGVWSDSDDFDLELDEPVLPPPADYEGPEFTLPESGGVRLSLPIIRQP